TCNTRLAGARIIVRELAERCGFGPNDLQAGPRKCPAVTGQYADEQIAPIQIRPSRSRISTQAWPSRTSCPQMQDGLAFARTARCPETFRCALQPRMCSP